MESLGVGLIGYGLAGRVFHAPLLATVEGLRLTHVVSSNADAVRRDWPQVQVLPDAAALLAVPGIDLVIVAAPNATHFPLAQQALLAGKHVVVDKPFVVHAGQGEELLRLAAARVRVLSVFHNRRWDGDFLTVREVASGGLLGEIHSYEAHYDRFSPQVGEGWREQDAPGSGVLYDLGSHLIDQALCLFGRPQTVWAEVGRQRSGASAPDFFHVALGYRERRVVLRAGSMVHTPGPRYQLHGTRGSFSKHGIDPQEAALHRGERPGAGDWGCDAPEAYGEIAFENGLLRVTGRVQTLPGAYQTYYRELHGAIVQGGAPPVLAREAVEVVRVIEAAQRSADTGMLVTLA